MSSINDGDILVVDEIPEEHDNEVFTGQTKWFNDKLGFGFITICSGDKKGTDIFCHHSDIKPVNSSYKTLSKGEYVQFNIIQGKIDLQAINITGINEGPLLCDCNNTRPSFNKQKFNQYFGQYQKNKNDARVWVDNDFYNNKNKYNQKKVYEHDPNSYVSKVKA
jgi:CspA family cold shock protein